MYYVQSIETTLGLKKTYQMFNASKNVDAAEASMFLGQNIVQTYEEQIRRLNHDNWRIMNSPSKSVVNHCKSLEKKIDKYINFNPHYYIHS